MTYVSRRRTALSALAVAAVAAATLATGAPADGATSMRVWSGTVTKGQDGDTELVDIAGDGKGALKVRNAGIQAMEVAHPGYRLECHASAASARMTALTAGKRVRLSAQSAASTSEGRLLRFVEVSSGGSWVDVQLKLLQEGHALWLNFGHEPAHAQAYHLAMEKAAAAGHNLWDDDYCGKGPSQGARLRMWVNYDANGDDNKNLNGEYVRVKNLGTTPVSVAGWHIRDASHTPPYVFPAGTVINAGQYLTVRVGSGTRTRTTFYWGQRTSQFGNTGTAGAVGDSAYLFDPQGDIRAHVSYPCVYRCTDPLAGKVRIDSITYDAVGDDFSNVNGEWTSISAVDPRQRIDLSNKVLELGGHIWEIPGGSYLNPGEHLRVYSGRGTNSRLKAYWNSAAPMLPNAGGRVSLRNTEGTRLACRAYGSARC